MSLTIRIGISRSPITSIDAFPIDLRVITEARVEILVGIIMIKEVIEGYTEERRCRKRVKLS